MPLAQWAESIMMIDKILELRRQGRCFEFYVPGWVSRSLRPLAKALGNTQWALREYVSSIVDTILRTAQQHRLSSVSWVDPIEFRASWITRLLGGPNCVRGSWISFALFSLVHMRCWHRGSVDLRHLVLWMKLT